LNDSGADGRAWRRKTGKQAVCAHLWRADACAPGVPVARTAGGHLVKRELLPGIFFLALFFSPSFLFLTSRYVTLRHGQMTVGSQGIISQYAKGRCCSRVG